jgi:hypothetical protein
MRVTGALFLSLFLCAADRAAAQDGRFELSGQLMTLQLGEFDATDIGAGVQAAWRLTPAIAIDGTFAWVAGGDEISSSLFENQQRVLGLAGLRAGISLGRAEIFGRARPGFLRFNHQDSAVCIAIAAFPLPLGCQLATGYTAVVFDAGAGARVGLDRARRTYLRLDAGDLMIRYGLEAYRPNGQMTDGFVGHNFVFSIGVGRTF